MILEYLHFNYKNVIQGFSYLESNHPETKICCIHMLKLATLYRSYYPEVLFICLYYYLT